MLTKETRSARRVYILAFTVVAVISLVVILKTLEQPHQQPNANISISETQGTSATNLGFSFIDITPKLAAYYNISAKNGALVTAVTPGSPAAKAGLREGDIIQSFNGVRLNAETPLLGMMMSCSCGQQLEMKTLRGTSMNTIRFVNADN